MKFLTTLLLLSSITCFAQVTDKKGTIKVKKEQKLSPSFKGGEQAFNRFLQSNLKYPASARDASISSICYVNFTIDANGQVSEVKLLKGVTNCHECDKEALRVMNIMPNWNPASANGIAFTAQVSMPINFRLK